MEWLTGSFGSTCFTRINLCVCTWAAEMRRCELNPDLTNRSAVYIISGGRFSLSFCPFQSRREVKVQRWNQDKVGVGMIPAPAALLLFAWIQLPVGGGVDNDHWWQREKTLRSTMTSLTTASERKSRWEKSAFCLLNEKSLRCWPKKLDLRSLFSTGGWVWKWRECKCKRR